MIFNTPFLFVFLKNMSQDQALYRGGINKHATNGHIGHLKSEQLIEEHRDYWPKWASSPRHAA